MSQEVYRWVNVTWCQIFTQAKIHIRMCKNPHNLKQGEISTKHLEGRIYGWCWRWCRQGFQQSDADNPFLFPSCRILILDPDPSSVALQIVQSYVVHGHLNWSQVFLLTQRAGLGPNDIWSRAAMCLGHLLHCWTSAGMRWNHFFSRTSTYGLWEGQSWL